MKIAVYGGSFDPPHLGHMEIIRESLRVLEIDKLIVMVAYQNPLKKRRLFSSARRLSLSLIHISEPTRPPYLSRMPSSA